MIQEMEQKLKALQEEKQTLREGESDLAALRLRQLEREEKELLHACKELSPADKVYIARHPDRPNITQIIPALFDSFFELKGDRLGKEDASILGGIAYYQGMPITVLGHRKGRTLEENLRCNFGMPGPEGYRKAMRLMEQADKFRRPIVTFIDTPGAYPGLEAEQNGQSSAIAQCLAAMSGLTVPVLAIVTGEGSSGGALAIGVANTVLMLEHAVYSILSPEGFASILYKDSSRSKEACEHMRLTAQDLLAFGLIDGIIPEPLGGAHRDPIATFRAMDRAISFHLNKLIKNKAGGYDKQRYQKFRKMGEHCALLQEEL